MEAQQEKKQEVDNTRRRYPQEQPLPNISQMEPVMHGAYGGGMYGTDDDDGGRVNKDKKPGKPPASETQSADGLDAAKATVPPKHPPPPSSGDRDIDITGHSYIQ